METEEIRSRGYWAETWLRFRRRKLAMLALGYVLFMGLVALFSPAIVGTKPVVCQYKGKIYFPCMGYFNARWENAIFFQDGIAQRYPVQLKEKDPESWAIYPLWYNDAMRRVVDDEMPGRPGNPSGDLGKPSWMNPFGTTFYGYDVAAIMIHGTRIALLVGFVSTGITAVIGIVLGAIAGYFGGWVDMLLSRLIELVMCIPTLVLILAFIAIVERPQIWHTMAIIGITGWPGIARLIRGEFIKLKQSEYVTAARALGTGQFRIIFRHILPNALSPVVVPISFGIAVAILIETGLSFLGIGASVSSASWGRVLSEGRANLSMWWLTFFPGLTIFLTVLAYNLIGEALQEATDPRLRGRE
ncbi:MAG: ABC transporter permease [Planctomycetia bacterium]|nr:ABC transporter permease [Planctomycetia bacterium]MDO5113057.1 ABC transporter permease [Planctomycetia bacterium]